MNPSNVKKELPYKNKGDLTDGAIYKHLIRLTIPMIWGIFAIISVQLADTYFISLLGTKELAAISFTFPATMLLTHLIFGINIATSSVVSRLIGEKKKEDVRRVVLHSIMTALGVSFSMAILCFVFLEPVFSILGADQTSMAIIKEYMPIWLLGFIFISIPMNGNSAIRASGDSFLPAITMTSLAIVNVVLDPILIFGLFGFPAMGIKGAAIATLISYIWGTFLGLYFLVIRKKLVCTDGLHLDKFKNSLKRLTVIAIPAGITNVIMPATNAVIVAILAGYGAEVVAAGGVAGRIEAFSLIAVIALATSMAPVVGQNWGAKKYDRVHQTIKMTIKFNILWSLAIALLLGVFAKQVAGIFSNDPEVIYYTALFFWIVPISYAFGNLIFGWSSAFNAMGMPKRSFVMIVVRAIATLAGVFIGSALYGVIGIFVALAIVNIVIGLFFHIISWQACLKHENT